VANDKCVSLNRTMPTMSRKEKRSLSEKRNYVHSYVEKKKVQVIGILSHYQYKRNCLNHSDPRKMSCVDQPAFNSRQQSHSTICKAWKHDL